MSDPADNSIQVQPPPLSHLAATGSDVPAKPSVNRYVLLLGLLVPTIAWVLWWIPGASQHPQTDTSAAPALPASSQVAASATTSTSTSSTRPQPDTAPFAQTQRERARNLAQQALGAFVERQIKLEDTMQVAQWGRAELDAAMQLAKTGDAAFLDEDYDTALSAYADAVTRIDEVIAQGEARFAQNLSTAQTAFEALQPLTAQTAIEQALAIAPSDAAANTLALRIRQLPDMITQYRTAKNHELAGRFAAALAIYAEIAARDPDAPELPQRRATALAAERAEQLAAALSAGFAALDREAFTEARTAFQEALQLDPDNAVARGGLQQVAQTNDLAYIRRLREQASAALQGEQWQIALDTYQEVLKMDANIQFALTGKRTAQAHLRVASLLEKISSEPYKLSSEALYNEALSIVDEARTLAFAGPQLKALTADVSELLVLYRDPVDVVLLSDNATRVVLSNVGDLGYFERKTLSLRPGRYTVRGSQRGCRDLYLSIDVLPGIEPQDLSCAERLSTVR